MQTMGEGVIEGNSLNFSFHAPQDVFGVMALMGGEKRFISALDELFYHDLPEYAYATNEDITKDCLIGGYVHGNEPSHHIPYLYAWTSQPWKTQYWMREIINRMYRPDIHGLGGNDDCGQMSAWYVLGAWGLYPVCPGDTRYEISSPVFEKTEIQVGEGNTFIIRANRNTPENTYIQSAKLNGTDYTRCYLDYRDIMKGGVLELEMGPEPNTNWGVNN